MVTRWPGDGSMASEGAATIADSITTRLPWLARAHDRIEHDRVQILLLEHKHGPQPPRRKLRERAAHSAPQVR